MSDWQIKPTEQDYKMTRELWNRALGVDAGIRAAVDWAIGVSADRELAKCIEWLRQAGLYTSADELIKSRRPSMKTRALDALNRAVSQDESFASSEATKVIREALESIDE